LPVRQKHRTWRWVCPLALWRRARSARPSGTATPALQELHGLLDRSAAEVSRVGTRRIHCTTAKLSWVIQLGSSFRRWMSRVESVVNLLCDMYLWRQQLNSAQVSPRPTPPASPASLHRCIVAGYPNGLQHAPNNVATRVQFEFNHALPRVFRQTGGRS
jgi:hypothetical protein